MFTWSMTVGKWEAVSISAQNGTMTTSNCSINMVGAIVKQVAFILVFGNLTSTPIAVLNSLEAMATNYQTLQLNLKANQV